MKKLSFFLVVLVVFSFISCSDGVREGINPPSYLIGSWTDAYIASLNLTITKDNLIMDTGDPEGPTDLKFFIDNPYATVTDSLVGDDYSILVKAELIEGGYTTMEFVFDKEGSDVYFTLVYNGEGMGPLLMKKVN